MLRPPAPHGTQEAGRASNAKKRVPPAVSAIAFCPTKQRLFCGQRSGDLVFWPLSETGHGGFARCLPCCGPLRGAGRLRPALLCHSHVWVVIMRLHGSAGRVAACISLHAQPPLLPAQCPTAGTCRYVGSHRGPITCICVPPTHGLEASPLSQGGLVLSGSVGGEMKIWDYQGKVGPGVPWQSSHPCCRLLAPHAFGPGLLHGTCPQFMADLLPSFQPAKAPPSKQWPRCPPPCAHRAGQPAAHSDGTNIARAQGHDHRHQGAWGPHHEQQHRWQCARLARGGGARAADVPLVRPAGGAWRGRTAECRCHSNG